MSLDRRQLILDRLAVILEPLTPNFFRNRGELPAAARPAITLCDADETASPSMHTSFEKGKRDLILAGGYMHLTPEIIISLPDQKPQNKTVGQLLSYYRALIISQIAVDSQITALVGKGEIQYRGCATDLGRNRQMDGEMSVMLTFVYPFVPSELIGG